MNKSDTKSLINTRDILSDEELAVLHQLFTNPSFDPDTYLAAKGDLGPNKSPAFNPDTGKVIYLKK
ncbi:MAG: hypothetical protein ACOX5W_00355 [Bacillota bacterium]|jgi:hypothetical protein